MFFVPTILAAALAAAPVRVPVPKLPGLGVYALNEQEFLARAREDVAELQRHAAGLERLREQLAPQRAALEANRETTYTPEQKRTLLSAWAATYDYVFSVELLRQRYWGFVQLPKKKVKHAWGYLLTHAALTTELSHGLAFSQWAAGHPQLEVLLDEASPELGIPAGAFARLKAKVIHVSTTTQLYTGDEYLESMQKLLEKHRIAAQPEAAWLLGQMRKGSEEARAILKARGVELFAGNFVDILKDQTLAGFFPVQKNVAEWMGDTRVRRLGKPLITREQAQALVEVLEPGDIMVARQNWFISNIGLPGFWPHAELYVGTSDQLAAFFDEDPQVKAWVAGQSGGEARFSAWLAGRYPKKWEEYARRDAHGEPVRIIESISEGVSFTGVGHGMLVDYLGAMRPRLSKLEKAMAIARAFEYQGRPYDFNFDFFSDATLVCTELVYKSYAPGEGMKGLKIGLVDVAGRMTLPANELVKLFDLEYDRPDRQLDFIGFLDGREAAGGAVLGSLEGFRSSYKRAKWDVAQE